MFLEGKTEQPYLSAVRRKASTSQLLKVTKKTLHPLLHPSCILLHHLGFGDHRPSDIYVDNKGAITMGLHPSNKPPTRHVDVSVHMP